MYHILRDETLPLYHRHPPHLFISIVGLDVLLMHQIPALHQADEEEAQQDVADVGVDVVKVGQHAQRVGAEEVVVADVLVACDVQHLRVDRAGS